MSTQTLWKTLGIDRGRFRFADARLDRSGLIAALECCRTVAPTESSDTSPHWGPARSPVSGSHASLHASDMTVSDKIRYVSSRGRDERSLASR